MSWDAFGTVERSGYRVAEVDDRPDTFILFIGDVWHSQPDAREHRFVIESVVWQCEVEGLLVLEGQDWVLRTSADSVVRGAKLDGFIAAVAGQLMQDRAHRRESATWSVTVTHPPELIPCA